MLRRRAFVGMLGAAAVLARAANASAQGGKVYRVGILAPGPLRPIESFKQRLRERGWVEGSTIRFEDRWAQGDEGR